MTANQTDSDAKTEVTPDAPTGLRIKPAFIRAREADEAEAEEHGRKDRQRAAFITANKKDKDGADVVGRKPGFTAADAAAPAAVPTPATNADDVRYNVGGAGWIVCSDGKKIRDDGASIHVPGSKISPAQMEMVLQLSMQKGWTKVYAYKPGTNKLHADATGMLSQMITAQKMPLECCTLQKHAGTFASHLADAENAIRRTQLAQHLAAKQPAPTPA